MTCYKEATKRLNEQFLRAIVHHHDNVHVCGSMVKLMNQYDAFKERFANEDESVVDDPFTFTHEELNLINVPMAVADKVAEMYKKELDDGVAELSRRDLDASDEVGDGNKASACNGSSGVSAEVKSDDRKKSRANEMYAEEKKVDDVTDGVKRTKLESP